MTAKKVFNNKPYGNIKGGITAIATSIELYPGQMEAFAENWEDDAEMDLTITDAESEIEIVKVTDIDGDTFTVERSQEGTTAPTDGWPAGAVISQRVTAGVAGSFIQKEAFREVYFNPNNIIAGDYTGEKVYEGGDRLRWWKNKTAKIWQLIAGLDEGEDDLDTIEPWDYDDTYVGVGGETVYHALCRVSENVYAHIFGDVLGGRILTWSVDSDTGGIGGVLDDDYFWYTGIVGSSIAHFNKIIKLGDTNYFAIGCKRSADSKYYVHIAEIADDGTITNADICNVEVGGSPILLHYEDPTYPMFFLAWGDGDGNPNISLYFFDAAGPSLTEITTAELSTDSESPFSLINIDGSIYAMFCNGGMVYTFDSSPAIIASKDIASGTCQEGKMVIGGESESGKNICFIYKVSATGIKISSMNISNNGENFGQVNDLTPALGSTDQYPDIALMDIPIHGVCAWKYGVDVAYNLIRFLPDSIERMDYKQDVDSIISSDLAILAMDEGYFVMGYYTSARTVLKTLKASKA